MTNTPKEEKGPEETLTLAERFWRDKLHKPKGSATWKDATNTKNRFANTATGATARKSRKGRRPG